MTLLCNDLGERVAVLYLVLPMAFLGVGYGQLVVQLRSIRARLRHEALTDPLTRLGNRRAFERDVERLQAQADRLGIPVLLTLWDLDRLKHVNDHHGHPVGDAYIARFAELLRASARDSDGLYRLGGDEFAGLHLGLDDGELLARRVRQRFPPVSVGWARTGEDGADGQKERADAALYRDKRRRRASQPLDAELRWVLDTLDDIAVPGS